MLYYSFKTIKLQLLALVCLLAVFNSCKKNNFSVDLEEVKQAPEAAQFTQNGSLRVDYYVSAVSGPFKIPVGLTNVTNEDREIKFVISSRSAVAGSQYTAPGSLVIKAGKAVDTLNFQGIFAGFPAGRKDTVKIKFDNFKGVDRKDSFELIMQRYCDVVLANLSGTYTGTREYNSAGALQYGPYTTRIKNLLATGPTSAEGLIENLYDYGWGDIRFTMDWSNPAAFKLTIPLQPTNDGGVSGVAQVRGTATGTNTFSSCDQTFTFTLDLLNSSGAVVSSAYQFRVRK